MKMRRTVCGCLVGLAIILTAPVPGIAAPLDEIAVDLRQQGYRIVEVRRTWLGRIQVTAEKSGFRREIVFDRTTGEIRRDLVENEANPGVAGRAKSLEEVIERGVDKVSKSKPKRQKLVVGGTAKPVEIDRPTADAPDRAGKPEQARTGRGGARPAKAPQGNAVSSPLPSESGSAKGQNTGATSKESPAAKGQSNSDGANDSAGVGTSSADGTSGGSESSGSGDAGTSGGGDAAGGSTGGDAGVSGGGGEGLSDSSSGGESGGTGGGEDNGTASDTGGESGGGDSSSGAGDTGGGQTGGDSSKSGG